MTGDLNGDGRPDVVISDHFGNRSMRVFFNTTPAPPVQRLMIEVLGTYGGRPVRNQSGRVVHVTPAANPASRSCTPRAARLSRARLSRPRRGVPQGQNAFRACPDSVQGGQEVT